MSTKLLFSQAQVLGFAGFTKETLRHWKTALSPIAGRDARSADYTIGELVTLSVLSEASRTLGLSISTITPHADQLFKLVDEDLSGGRIPGPFAFSQSGLTRFDPNHGVDGTAALILRFEVTMGKLWDEFGLPPKRKPTSQLELPV